MSDKTSIEWTDATFNPWWGCTKVSPGCDNCYAERDARRFGTQWGADAERRQFGESHWLKPIEWDRRAAKAGQAMRVFCASMADVFDKDAPPGAREMLWDTIYRTPMLRWQLLTKRIGNVARMVPEHWTRNGFPQHVWLGISVVNQEEADRDIPKLIAMPACVRFLSCEPLLDTIDLREEWIGLARSAQGPFVQMFKPPLSWVIAGGESGPKARPMHPDSARSLRDQCAAASVPFLFKQWGEWSPDGFAQVGECRSVIIEREQMFRVGKKAAGRLLDGRTHDEYPQ